jgi:hypothetical protein
MPKKPSFEEAMMRLLLIAAVACAAPAFAETFG